jgi:hypothetical protein
VSIVNSIIEQCNTKCFKFTVKTQKQYINIGILLWQHVLVLLEHLKARIQRQEVKSVHWLYLYNVFWHCCCFLTVTSEHFVLLVVFKHNGVSSIEKNEKYKFYDECTRNQGKKCMYNVTLWQVRVTIDTLKHKNTFLFTCIVDIHVVVRCIKVFTVAVQMQ